MATELCYIGKTGTYRVPSVSNELKNIATFVGENLNYVLAIVFVKTGNESNGVNGIVPYILSSRPNNTAFGRQKDNIDYKLIMGYNTDERLAFCIGSKVYYLVDLPVAKIYLLFQLKATYSITVDTRNVAPHTYVTYITTDSAIRVDLQYNNYDVPMRKTWYCRLKVYNAYNVVAGTAELRLVYTSSTVTVPPAATHCAIPKIDVNTGTDYKLPVYLYIEYSFDKSNWTYILLHKFLDSSTSAIACTDLTTTQSHLKKTVY